MRDARIKHLILFTLGIMWFINPTATFLIALLILAIK
jgi:EamA domain-containing membrane protein RarD